MIITLNNLKKENIIVTVTLEQLPQLAKRVGEFLQAGDWLFLDGDLGSGKTALAKEISLYFGVKNFFISPTFSILHNEKLPIAKGKIENLLHLDLYRLKSGKELCFIGLEQEFNVKNSIAIFEWPDVIDEEEWEHFFSFTGCTKPTRIINIKIEINNKKRNYELSLLGIKQSNI